MVHKEHKKFLLGFCRCRPDFPYRGNEWLRHKKKCEMKNGRKEFRACVKCSKTLALGATDIVANNFYNEHKECPTRKVTSPQSKEFFASVFASDRLNEVVWENGKEMDRKEELGRKEEMMVSIADEDDEEDDDEDEVTDSETEEAVENILAFTDSEVDRWLTKEAGKAENIEQLSDDEVEDEGVRKEAEEKLEVRKENGAEEKLEVCQEKKAEENKLEVQKQKEAIFIGGHEMQGQAIRDLKDRLAARDKIISELQDKVRQLEREEERMKTKEREARRLQLCAEETLKVLEAKEEALEEREKILERREATVEKIDEKIKEEKRDVWKMRDEVEVMTKKLEAKAEEEVKRAAETEKKTEEARKKMEEAEERMKKAENMEKKVRMVIVNHQKNKNTNKQDNTTHDIESDKEIRTYKSTIHIPIKHNKIDADPHIQLRKATQRHFPAESHTCVHLHVTHSDNFRIHSYSNTAGPLPLKRHMPNVEESSDESDFFIKRRKS